MTTESTTGTATHLIEWRSKWTWRGKRWSYNVWSLTPTGGKAYIIFTCKQQYTNRLDAEVALRNAAAAVAAIL